MYIYIHVYIYIYIQIILYYTYCHILHIYDVLYLYIYILIYVCIDRDVSQHLPVVSVDQGDPRDPRQLPKQGTELQQGLGVAPVRPLPWGSHENMAIYNI